MKRALKWAALGIGTAWLVWAMVGDAPGELKPIATAELLQRVPNVTPTPAKAPTTAPRPTATATRMPATPTQAVQNVALCQDALQRRQAFLAERFDAQRAALWGSKSTDGLTAEIDAMLRLDLDNKALDKELKMFALSELLDLRSATAAVERYCGR